MTTPYPIRHRRVRLPISSPMHPEELTVVDRAADALGVSRSEFIRRAAIRHAHTTLRRIARTGAVVGIGSAARDAA